MSSTAIPAFEPKVTPQPGDDHLYQDGRVTGVVALSNDQNGKPVVVIYEWTSHFKGQRHTTDALHWLRANFGERVVACNIGMPSEPGEPVEAHTAYWIHMKRKGLVDQLVDDDGYHFPVPDQLEQPTKSPVRPAKAEIDDGPGF